jgi:hypothetical protein
MKLGRGTMTANISLVGPITLTSIANLSLITGGTISQGTSDSITVAGLNADGGTVTLPGANAVTNLQGQARSGTGSFYFVNTGAVNLATVDPGNAVAGVASASTLYISADGGISSSLTGNYAAQGTDVSLYSTAGALGSAAIPLQVRAASLNAGGATGVYVDSNQFNPAPVTVTLLENLTSGDIRLNAWGGATVTTLVSNPGGSVFIHTHSPLEVLAGISAGQGIDLATGGASPNDMLLDGPFTYGQGYDFSVALGTAGVLNRGTSYSGAITILNGVRQEAASTTTAELAQSVGTTLSGTERAEDAGTSTTETMSEDEKKKREREKKGANVCK